jgi:hypothetical protein
MKTKHKNIEIGLIRGNAMSQEKFQDLTLLLAHTLIDSWDTGGKPNPLNKHIDICIKFDTTE